MVPLPRRLAALLIALIATVSVTGTALGSVSDVINDYSRDGTIDVCHSTADYASARTKDVESQYGSFQDALDTALATPALVGTDAKPCPEIPTSNGSGIGGVALIAIPIGLVIVALVMVWGGRRRRNAQGEGPDTEVDGSASTEDHGPDAPA